MADWRNMHAVLGEAHIEIRANRWPPHCPLEGTACTGGDCTVPAACMHPMTGELMRATFAESRVLPQDLAARYYMPQELHDHG